MGGLKQPPMKKAERMAMNNKSCDFTHLKKVSPRELLSLTVQTHALTLAAKPAAVPSENATHNASRGSASLCACAVRAAAWWVFLGRTPARGCQLHVAVSPRSSLTRPHPGQRRRRSSWQ